MEISFETRELRDICEDEYLAEAALLTKGSELLRARLSDIRAADSVEDLYVFQPIKGVYDGLPSLIFELTASHAMVIVPQGKNVHRGTTESPWQTARRVKVVSLEKTNVN